MRTVALFLIATLVRAQAPISLTNTLVAGITQPTVTTPTVTGGAVQTPITIAAGIPCTAAPTVTIFSSNGAGSGATATATCTNSLVDTSITVTAGGTLYTQNFVFITFGAALMGMVDNHAHSIPTAGNSPTCKTTCAFACSNYKSMSLSEKTSSAPYTSTDPGASCRTVTSGAGSCPVYNATTWAIATVTNSTTLGAGVATHIKITSNVNALGALLSTNNSTPTPTFIFGTSTGLTVTPAISGGGAGNITSLINTVGGSALVTAGTDFPWYLKNVVVVAGTSVDADLYYAKSTNGVADFNTAVVTTGTPGGSPVLSLGGCGSVDTGTDGNAVIAISGLEADAADNHALYSRLSYKFQTIGGNHHMTALNVSGAPIPSAILTSNDWYTIAKYFLDNPDPTSGALSAINFAHPNYDTIGWSPQQLALLVQLRTAYSGRVHVQVSDAQVPSYADGAWDFLNAQAGGIIPGDGSGDSYNSGIFVSSGLKGSGTILNVDSWTVPNIMNAVNSARSYFWSKLSSGVPRAMRIGVPVAGSGVLTAAPTTIVCKSLTSETTPTAVSKTFLWIKEGGWIVKKTAGVNQDSYTVSGTDGKYIRVMIVTTSGNSYADNFAYNVGQNIDNFFYNGLKFNAGGLTDFISSQPIMINYGGTTGGSSPKVPR